MATLTAGEQKVLNLAWQCFQGSPQINYKKLAEIGNYKTAASATACYLAAKKKIQASGQPKLTDGERKVLGMALHCVTSMPKVDYKKLQQMGDYKTPASATACYLAAKKKLLQSAAPVSGVEPELAGSSNPSPNAGNKRKQHTQATEGNDNKQKRRKNISTAIESAEAHEDARSTAVASAVKSETDAELETGEHLETGAQIKQEQLDELVGDHLLATAAEYLADAEQSYHGTLEVVDRADTPVA